MVRREAENIAVSSLASLSKLSSFSFLMVPVWISDSSQNALSSASSKTMPSFEMNSARDLPCMPPDNLPQPRATAEKLLSHHLGIRCARQRTKYAHDTQCKSFRPISNLFRRRAHVRFLAYRSCSDLKSQFTNRKSQILYRSISPSTISMLPIAATTSAISLPSHI
jgi:hypothetical protein